MLGSLRGGVAMIDGDFVVQLWNERAQDLWGLRPDEARGRNLLGLDIGLPIAQIMPALRECVAGLTVPEEVILEARNRRGKPVRCRVSCTPLKDGDATRGAIIVMEEVPQLDGEGDGVLSDGRRAGVLEG